MTRNARGKADDGTTMTLAQAGDCFRHELRRNVERLFEMAEVHGLTEHSALVMIALETMGLSAFAHRGDRETFMQMARDAIAIAQTGEFEQ
jgi:hypothetical protein